MVKKMNEHIKKKDPVAKDADEEIKPSRLKQQKKTHEDEEREEGRDLLEAIQKAILNRSGY